MKLSIMLLLAFTVPCVAQIPAGPTSKAETKGDCSPSVTGNNNNFKFSCGVGKDQGKQIIALLNKLLAHNDIATVIAKLNDMQADISKLKDSTAPRRLTSDQQEQLGAVARGYPGQSINVAINRGDAQSADYALQFIQAFKQGNWQFFAGGDGYGQATYTPPIHRLVFLINPADEEKHQVSGHCVALYNKLIALQLNPIGFINQNLLLTMQICRRRKVISILTISPNNLAYR